MYTIKRVTASGVRQESMLYWAWRTLNGLIGYCQGHVHGGITAGAGNTSAKLFGGQGGATMANEQGTSIDTGAAVTGLPGSGGNARRVRPSSRADSLLAELIESYNAFAQSLDNHVHGGVTAGGAATAAASGGAAPLTELFQIVDIDGTDPYTRAAITQVVPAAQLKPVRRGRGFAEDLASLVSSLNVAVQALYNHTHTATAGGASSTAFDVPAGVQKVADLNGRGPDGDLVT